MTAILGIDVAPTGLNQYLPTGATADNAVRVSAYDPEYTIDVPLYRWVRPALSSSSQIGSSAVDAQLLLQASQISSLEYQLAELSVDREAIGLDIAEIRKGGFTVSNSSSMLAAVAIGKTSGYDYFIAHHVDGSGSPLQSQIWQRSGIGAGAKWTLVSDSAGGDLSSVQDQFNTIQNNLDDLEQILATKRSAGLILLFQTSETAPTDPLVLPSTIQALDPADYDETQPHAVYFSDYECVYQVQNGAWVRVQCTPNDISGQMPPPWPHPTADVQTWAVEGVLYVGVWKGEGADRTAVSLLDTQDAKDNWYCPGKEYGFFHHDAIAHMFDTYDVVRVYGKPGSVFALTDPAAELAQIQASPYQNPAYTEYEGTTL